MGFQFTSAQGPSIIKMAVQGWAVTGTLPRTHFMGCRISLEGKDRGYKYGI